MALSEYDSGSASIGTTEFDLINSSTSIAASTDAGVYQLFVDVNAMAAGDQYEFAYYEKSRSGDTARRNVLAVLTGAQANALFAIPPLHLMHGWTFTAKKLAGTDRTLNWSIRRAS